MASQNSSPRITYLQAFLPFPANHGFLVVNSLPPANLANQTRPLSQRTNEEYIPDRARTYQGNITLADPHDFSSGMTRTTAQDNTNMDANGSDISEGESIDHDPLPTLDKLISGAHKGRHDNVTESASQLGPESRIPPPLKAIINRWCAAQGPGYSLDKLPCATKRDTKSINCSFTGSPAAWQDDQGKPMIAKMYALSGTDLKQGNQKILVVEGVYDLKGPSIVSYVNGASNNERVCYKRWIGVGGDTDGYEDGIAAVKVITPQTQPPQGKRRETLPEPSTKNDVVVASDLDHSGKRTRKRKGVEVSVEIPTQEANPTRHISKNLRSHTVAMNDTPLEKRLAAPPQEPVASATKATSVLSNATSPKNLSEKSAPAEYKPEVSSKPEVSHNKAARDMLPPMDPTGNDTAQRVLRKSTQKVNATGSKEVISASQGASPSRRSPSHRPAKALDLHSMACDETLIPDWAATSLMKTENSNRSSGYRGSSQDSMLGESPISQMLDVAMRTTESPARSHEQATIGESPQRGEVRGNAIDSGPERSTDGAIGKTGTSSMQNPEPSQNREPTALLTPSLTHGSTEITLESPGGERQLIKTMRKLKLSQVFVKFNAANPLTPSEPPRIRPFSACDTVGKLFNQARTGNVFGNASDVRSGGKLLSVEFRGSARLPDEVYLINEDDEEDFRRMRTALLRKDWWTEVEERVYGGGLLDVRHMS